MSSLRRQDSKTTNTGPSKRLLSITCLLGDAQMRAKMTNWLELFRKFELLDSVNFYYKTLKQTAHLAYVMQNSSVLITDILDTMNDVIEKLEDLQKEEAALPLSSEKVNGDLLIRPVLTNLPATKRFREANRNKAKSNSTELVIHHEYKGTAVRGVSKIKKHLLPGIVEDKNWDFSHSKLMYNKSLQISDQSAGIMMIRRM